ncbi:DNA topology modulation protein [Terribacillus saccharophilus]|uniref:DNA topology modulation protein n=1 Tax=Terribacillus saccharophilus TaxID=361277 RepID=UPI003982599F
MNRIALIGSGGAGKSTLAMELGKILGIEVWHLDAILWKPNWVLTPREEQKQIQSQLVSKGSWIIDGNYQSTLDMRLEQADTIIFLDMPRTLCLYRVLKRRLMYHNRSRPDMQKDCKEKIDWQFLKWIWDFPKRRRPQMQHKLADLTMDKQIITLKSPKEVKRFLADIRDRL